MGAYTYLTNTWPFYAKYCVPSESECYVIFHISACFGKHPWLSHIFLFGLPDEGICKRASARYKV